MERKRRSLAVIWKLQLFLLPLIFTGCQGMRDIDGTARSAMGALQRDMKMLGDITICTGLKRYIACIEGSNLAITKAFWGRISDKVCPSDDGDPVTDCDGSEDTLPLVKGYCEGKRECKLEARHTLLQKNGTHHCPGVNKYLVVNYTCIPESKSVTLCDSAETTLMCEAGWVIDVADVFWGRRSHAKYCGAEEGMECDSSDSASKYIRQACDGHRRCPVRADPGVLDNAHSPCSTILKYLMINYVCKPPEKGRHFPTTDMVGLLEDHFSPDPKSPESAGLDEQVEKTEKVEKMEKLEKVGKEPKTKTKAKDNEDREFFPLQEPASPSRKGKEVYFTSMVNSEENAELSKALIRGEGLPGETEHSEHASKKQDHHEDRYEDIVKEGYRRSRQERKGEMTQKRKDEVSASKRDKEESPLSFDNDREDEIRKERSEKVMNAKRDKQAMLKELFKKNKNPLTDEGYYDDEFTKLATRSRNKPAEPTTVRSILARAKEVLQSLASDNSKFEAVIEKRGNIAAIKNESAPTKVDTTKSEAVNESACTEADITKSDPVNESARTEADTTKSDLATITKSDLVHDLTKEKTTTPVISDILKETAAAFSTQISNTVKKATLPKPFAAFGNTP